MNNIYFNSIQFLKIIEQNQELLNFIQSISNKKSQFVIPPQKILNAIGNATVKVSLIEALQRDITTNNNQILNLVRSIRPNRIYDLTNSFLTELNLFDSSYNDSNSLIKLLKAFPDKHTDAYSEKEAKQIFNIVENCYSIAHVINGFIETAEYVVEKHDESESQSPLNYIPLRIGTDQDIPRIGDFILIFKNIEELYNFICRIYKIDPGVNRLILNQIGTGSWFTELLGIKQVVVSCENLLNGMGGFIRDVITGKIALERFENECKRDKEYIKLMALAKKNGIDNAELGVFKRLKPLVKNFSRGTTTININDEEILKLKKADKLTLLEKQSERTVLLNKINLSLEADNKNKKSR